MIDKMSITQMIEVLKAAREGKAIQHRDAFNDWRYCNPTIPSGFLFYGDNEYRVAPELRKPREFWIRPDFGHPAEGFAYSEKPPQPERWGFIHVREVLE